MNHISAKCWWIYKSSYKSCRNICKVSILKYWVILSVTQWLWWPVFNVSCVLIYLRRWVVSFKICIIKWKLACLQAVWIYRDEINSLQIQLSRTQAGPGRAVKEQQEQNSPNHVQRINLTSVLIRFCNRTRNAKHPNVLTGFPS